MDAYGSACDFKHRRCGGQFAEEARKMHYGETPERAIRGQVSREETSALLEEGIQVMPLPMPAAIKGPVQ